MGGGLFDMNDHLWKKKQNSISSPLKGAELLDNQEANLACRCSILEPDTC